LASAEFLRLLWFVSVEFERLALLSAAVYVCSYIFKKFVKEAVGMLQGTVP